MSSPGWCLSTGPRESWATPTPTSAGSVLPRSAGVETHQRWDAVRQDGVINRLTTAIPPS